MDNGTRLTYTISCYYITNAAPALLLRSLIALSLIMALLQFKPAPMYILDEIDAALDLSHTQHIGQLFKNRFKGSQFIVVSLKEGLFTNANVLFRAQFRDGTSIVTRTAQVRSRYLYA